MITYPISTVAAADQQRAIAPLVLAFADDPVMRFAYPESGEYLRHFPEFVEIFAGTAFELGTAYSTDGFGATALWLPPGTPLEEEALVALMQRSIADDRRDALFEILGRLEEHHPKVPHWYLPIIGVDPTLQGRGYGSALLERVLARCDADRLPAYLESSNERNIPLYERHGFEVRDRIQAGDSPSLWPMVREPR